MVAADVDDVVAGTADHGGFKILAGAEDVDLVGAARAVHFQRLDVAEVHDTTGAGNIPVSDDEDVADRRADDDNGVNARSAVDFDRRILKVFVAVEAGAAEERGEVGHIVRIIGVLLQHEEGLEQEAVVARAAVEEELGLVVIDLEAVVLVGAEDIQIGRVAVGHVLGVGHRNAFGELEGAVALVGNQRDGADQDFVVAAAHVYHGDAGGVVAEHAVVAGEGVDRDALQVAEREDVAVRAGDFTEGDDAGPEGAAAGGVQRQDVGLIGAADEHMIETGLQAAVVDRDPTGARAGEADDIELGVKILVVRAVVEIGAAQPRRHGQVGGTDGDDAVDIANNNGVVALAALEHGVVEDVVQFLDRGSGTEAVAAAEEVEVGVLLADEILQSVLAARARGGEVGIPGVAEQVADDEVVVEDREVAIERLVQGVEAAGIGKGVQAETAGDGVIAGAAVQNVVEWGANQAVMAVAAAELEDRQVLHPRVVGVHNLPVQRRGIDEVIPALAIDNDPVTLGPFTVDHIDPVVVLPGNPVFLKETGGVVRVLRRHDKAVIGAVAHDSDHVASAIIGEGDIGHFEAVVIDHLAHVGGVVAEVGGDRFNAAIGKVADQDGVGSAAGVDGVVLHAMSCHGRSVEQQIDLPCSRAAVEFDHVARIRSADDHEVLLPGAVVGMDHRTARGRVQSHDIASGSGVDGVRAAAADNDIVA